MSQPCLPLLQGQPEDFIGWSCGLMDKALVLGTKDCRFESCQDHGVLICPSNGSGFSDWEALSASFIKREAMSDCLTLPGHLWRGNDEPCLHRNPPFCHGAMQKWGLVAASED